MLRSSIAALVRRCGFALVLGASYGLPAVAEAQARVLIGREGGQAIRAGGTMEFAPETGPAELLKRIATAVTLAPTFRLQASRDGSVATVAAAVDDRGATRYVLYNPDFLNRFTQTNPEDWRAVLALAHVVGHHVNGHTLPGADLGADEELVADRFSGLVLARLGATKEQAADAARAVSGQQRGDQYPSAGRRAAAVAEGWQAGNAGGPPARPDSDASPDRAVLAVLERYHKAIRERDARTLRAVFTEDAEVEVRATNTDGQTRVYDLEKVIARLTKGTGKQEERMTAPRVTINGSEARVTARYSFLVDGKVSNCGTERYELVRSEDSGWQIERIVDTQRSTGCGADR